ncbi:carboxypeptidase regulatory-like domain-containing protein [Planctomicrobium sp. SH527]|uniref:carboxypeptidase regulatory-like domain-containing protein n=1 Tax=Planctomicrobium sp. SH527 TaxID=3448123 RepID=UPI003F5B50C7
MPASLSSRILGFVVIAFLFSSGCSGNSAGHPDVGAVSGVVTLDGAPLADAIVEFSPESGRPSSALTDAEGRYSLTYLDNVSGALLGTHTVRISTGRYATQPDGSSIPVPEKLPAKYHEKSTITKEVKARMNQFDFELTSK